MSGDELIFLRGRVAFLEEELSRETEDKMRKVNESTYLRAELRRMNTACLSITLQLRTEIDLSLTTLQKLGGTE